MVLGLRIDHGSNFNSLTVVLLERLGQLLGLLDGLDLPSVARALPRTDIQP